MTRLTDRIYDLDMGLAMALDREHDKTIRCVETHLWIAEEGWAEEIILVPTECAASKRSLRAVIAALIGKMRLLFGAERGDISRVANAAKGL